MSEKNREKYTKEFIERLFSELGTGKNGVASHLGITKNQLDCIIQYHGIKPTNGTSYMRLGKKVNESYFEKIDSIDKAYFLGLLFADGCVHKRHFRISLVNDDGYILEKMKIHMGAEQIIGTVNSDTRYGRGVHRTFVVGSVKMVRDLASLGMHPRKSLTCEFPTFDQVPRELIWHFIRGYLDGDGCITHYKKEGMKSIGVKFCVSERFGASMKALIEKELDINCYFRKSASPIHEVATGGRIQSLKLLDRIYENCGEFKLTRKYEKYLEAKEYSPPSMKGVKKKKYAYTHKYNGVHIKKRNGWEKFRVEYKPAKGCHTKAICIGYFDTEDLAVKAFDEFCVREGLFNYNFKKVKPCA